MAPSASSHNFQKLKLDISPQNKPVVSTFASFPRQECPPPPAKHAGTPPQDIYDGAAVKRVPSDCNGRSYGGSSAVGSSGSEEDDLLARFNERRPSIAFSSEVRLDNGERHALEVPIPKPSRQSHSRTTVGESYSDQEYLEMPYSVRRHMQYRAGEARYPLAQTTVDDLTKHPEYIDQVASLTSATTASPPLDEAQTPLETPTEYMLSPMGATSPSDFPLFARRNVPIRNKSYRSEIGDDGSLRRASRRSSMRSGRSLSSMSPAASFLARYKASEAPIKPSEPDDEGQGIGYEGEYIIGKQIGYGGFSIVKEVTSMEDGKPVVNAVKIVRKTQRDKSEFENERIQSQFDHEVEIWRFLRHPYILPLLRVYTTEFATFCITKLNKGGTLFDLVRETRRQKKPGLPAHLVKRYAYQLASAMRYLHNDVQVVHRDIKLENCLVDMTVSNSDHDGGDLLLCDFGMADFIVSDQRDGPEPVSSGDNLNIGPADTSTSFAGSLQYAAPELFSATSPVFSPAADMWAFGVVVFSLLTARLPFDDGLDIKTTEKIQNGDWDEELVRNAEAVKDGCVDDVLALVKGCLTMDPEQRWTVNDVLNCSWLAESAQQFESVNCSWVADS
ncbi:hypothetical protein J1614_002992 [Plenodomus biglobosus]|nr:hypothetical protein J1614_002992 [Plenodomus biglobosus]